MPVSKDIRGLLLCGGSSTRFGKHKLLVPLRRPREGGEELPMVVHAARNLAKGAGNALAIIPPGSLELRRALEDAGCDIFESDQTSRGLGASLAAGVAHVPGARGWIVALGDMPFIRAATIARVRSALEGGAIVAAPVLAATGMRGHPVGFARSLKDELIVCDGDEGARGVIARHRAALVSIPVDDRGIVIDIDTPGDLDAATAS